MVGAAATSSASRCAIAAASCAVAASL
eukprot:SAG31_NODE_3177_length_4584_cov_10.428999_4_plen_26_part_01